MSETDPRVAERSFYDDTDYADLDLEAAEDVRVAPRPAPRSTFALRLDGSTIDQLRELAQRRSSRPTQLARDWLIERLDQEQRELADAPEIGPTSREGRFEARIANLEQAFVNLAASTAAAGLPSTSKDADLVADLEARAKVARELRQRLDAEATVEAPPGADLVVRCGGRTWVIEVKGGAVDLVPSVQHVRTLAMQMNARPVLVSPQLPDDNVEALSRSSGVHVVRPDDLDDLLAQIASRHRSSEDGATPVDDGSPAIARPA